MLLFFALFAVIQDVLAIDTDPAVSSNWAVLIAGSNSYYNYRHQADISHAYQILTKMGNFPKENVIVMMYNDVVNASENPYPGQLFNEPNGNNVYSGIQVDYQGLDVNASNFLNVIQGIPNPNLPNKPVLKSTSNDNVFIYFSDHGAAGLVCMPTGEPLYADQLINALNNMHSKQMYNQLVFYIEACESGSMFADGLLPNNISVFATTAANPTEPSYAYYYNQTLGTYMADEYSIRWMQDSTNNWNNWESLIQQYKNVEKAVKESHPQQYGYTGFDDEAIEFFEAFQDRSASNSTNETRRHVLKKLLKSSHKSININSSNVPEPFVRSWIPSNVAMSSRDIKLAILQRKYLSANSLMEKLHYQRLVSDEVDHRNAVDDRFDELIDGVIPLFSNLDEYNDNDDVFQALKYGHIKPTNFDCLRNTYNAYEQSCEAFTDYSLKYVSCLVNICEIYGDSKINQFHIISKINNLNC